MSVTGTTDQIRRGPAGRKLVAIVYADMVGYSRLIGLDDIGTLERLRALRANVLDPAIAAHGGRIVQTGGDSLLIVFDSIDGAVRYAVQMQREIPLHDGGCPGDRLIRFRVGINIGDAIADGSDLHGEAVNVAVRLEAECSPGAICVTQAVRDHMQGRSDLTFEALGALSLKNIAQPVEAFMLRPDAAASRLPSDLGNLYSPRLSGKPSIAVLPFTNMSGDPEQGYFSDGLADDIITELSRSASLLVISGHSSFSYRGQSVDVKRVARELGVRYIVEGSVRRVVNRVRVNAKLVDAEAGNHIWAERYDRAVEDVFAVQDEIVLAVTAAISPLVDDAEQRRAIRKHPESLSAWEAYQRGRSHMRKFDAAENAKARTFFERAIALNPGFAPAYSALALTCHYEGSRFAGRPLREANEEAQLWALKAVEVDPGDADAQIMLANVTHLMGDREAARERASRALASAQVSAWSIGTAAGIWLSDGRSAEARDLFFTAMRLSPRDPLVPGFLRLISMSYYFEGDFLKAAEAAKRAVAFQPDNPMGYKWLATSLGQLGRADEAREALYKAMGAPDTFDLYVRERPPWFRVEDYELMLDGLRKAGWAG
jgi:adenylate cyclase